MSKSSLAAINTHTEKDVLKLNYSYQHFPAGDQAEAISEVLH